MSQYYCISKMSLVAIALLMIIIASTILQPALASTNLPLNTTGSAPEERAPLPYTEYNSSTLVPSNQPSTLFDKTNVTLRGLFDNLGDPGRWNKLLQPALDQLNRRHPDMNIQIEYTDFFYNETRSRILDR